MSQYPKAPLAGQVLQIDLSTTGAAYAIPAAYAGKRCQFVVWPDAPGTAHMRCDIAFGGSGVSVTFNTDSGTSLTLSTSTGALIYSGVQGSREWIVPTPDVATHFAVDSDGAGKLQIIKME